MFKELATFLTFRCTANCRYCLQQGIDRNAYNEVEPKQWIDWLDTSTFVGGKLSLIGGEPTIYKGFVDIIDALHNKYLITVTTNLNSPLFNDMNKFLQWATSVRVRWNVSFHPNTLPVEKFIDTVTRMRIGGAWVDQVAAVHTKEVVQHLPALLKANIGFWLQCPTWIEDEVLHPTKDELFKFGSGESMIVRYNNYEKFCGNKEESTGLCYTGKFLVNPEGDTFRCHSDLYNNRCSIGNIFIDTVRPNFLCKNAGKCNPCDFSSIRFFNMEE